MKSGWEDVRELLESSSNKIDLVPALGSFGFINEIGIHEQSVLGQVLANASVLVINRYLVVLGQGNKKLTHGIVDINNVMKQFYPGNKLFVAYDIWGGLFALDNGDFGGTGNQILWYYAPDSLRWECLGISYAEFIAWVCSDNLNEYYQSFVWSDFSETEINVQHGDAVLIYPFLWSEECDIETASKTVVPLKELVRLNFENEKRLHECAKHL